MLAYWQRFRIRSWCRISTDSATTQRIPPGVASRMMMPTMDKHIMWKKKQLAQFLTISRE